MYSNPVSWAQDEKKGTMINVFIILWPLLLAGYVDGLEQVQKDKWYATFHGHAAQDMADMVLHLG